MTDYGLDILQHICRDAYSGLSVSRLARDMDIPPERYEAFRCSIKSLKAAGKLRVVRGKVLPAGGAGTVTGVIHITRQGWATVAPEGADRSPQDIFVPGTLLRDALDGDTVIVEVSKKRGFKGLRQGSVRQVIVRRHTGFVGVVRRRRWGLAAEVKNGGQAIDMELIGSASSLATGARIVVRLEDYDAATGRHVAALDEVIGLPGDPEADMMTICHEFNLPKEFSQATLDAASAFSEASIAEEAAERLDLRSVFTVTIDPDDARDFDDAISLERLDDGRWRLMVHIADVSHYVVRGTALDREARHRGTSVYLPGRVIPMLPEALSNNLCSLRPDADRLAKTVAMTFSAGAELHDATVEHTVIRSDRRLNYDEVWNAIEGHATTRRRLGANVCSLIDMALELAKRRHERRYEAGALDLDLPDSKIVLRPDGGFDGVQLIEHNWAHRIIEEFMIAANIAVARDLRRRDLPCIYRHHGPPDTEDVAEFTFFAKQMGLDVKAVRSHHDYQILIETVRGTPVSFAVNMGILKSLQKAVYSAEARGHFALALDDYCHFTSPIRRYPDLIVHQILDAAAGDGLSKKARLKLGAGLEQVADECSELERRAEKAERELYTLKVLNHLSKRIGETVKGVITGVKPFGCFVLLEDYLVDGLLRLDELSDDWYDVEPGGFSLKGRRHGVRYAIGDELEPWIKEVDLDRRELDLSITQSPSLRSSKKPIRKKQGKKRRR